MLLLFLVLLSLIHFRMLTCIIFFTSLLLFSFLNILYIYLLSMSTSASSTLHCLFPYFLPLNSPTPVAFGPFIHHHSAESDISHTVGRPTTLHPLGVAVNAGHSAMEILFQYAGKYN